MAIFARQARPLGQKAEVRPKKKDISNAQGAQAFRRAETSQIRLELRLSGGNQTNVASVHEAEFRISGTSA